MAWRICKYTNILGWSERNQQDATNLMYIIKLLSQHVSGIITPIIRRTRPCTTACGVLHWLCWLWLCGAGSQAMFTVHTAVDPASHYSQHNQCKTPHAVVHGLVLLMMGIMVPQTCWDRSLIIHIRLVASCWFLSLHPTLMMHGHKSLKPTNIRWVRFNRWAGTYLGLHIESPLLLSDFNQDQNTLTDFSNPTQYKISRIFVQWFVGWYMRTNWESEVQKHIFTRIFIFLMNLQWLAKYLHLKLHDTLSKLNLGLTFLDCQTKQGLQHGGAKLN